MALDGKLHIIPLGGLGEIGKNMTVFRYGSDMVVVDCGLKFPEDEMLGVDIVIPDITYLKENSELVRGIVLTHGHEDHIGALPYVLREIAVPVYGTRLTLGLLGQKLLEHDLPEVELKTISVKESLQLGCFRLEFFRVCHSIADAIGIAIHTPVGTVVHSGDFKIDHTPVDGGVMDFHRLAELGRRGVLALLSDSTNAEKPGYTLSERVVGESFENTIRKAKGRVIIATFASNVHRVQQAISMAHRYDRQVAVVGRSIENVVRIAEELGYLDVPPGILVDVGEINRYPPERQVILTTGSQGEPMSAL
ncbi:MAG: ribonuclease J, partial [Syntrophomonadaceae bacterium]|nr:ribonuclease J [Syntrophomonadaceae bacterium]